MTPALLAVMPSFVCDVCQDTIKKPKLDQHLCESLARALRLDRGALCNV